MSVFRDSETYHKKLLRVGAAMRRYQALKSTQTFCALSLEVDALEELSLSAFSLMKAIKNNLADASKRPDTKTSCIIRPRGWLDDEEENR